MAEQLASVPEDSTTVFPAPYPPSSSYRESIRSVNGLEWRIRSSHFTKSGLSGSSYSSSYSSVGSVSNISACSSDWIAATVSASDFAVGELTKIAQRMVTDGYIQQMVQEFGGQNPGSVLQAWFSELDFAWVFQSRESHGSELQLQLQGLVHKWIRSLTLTVLGIKELVAADDVTPAVARFGKATISALLDFVHVFNLHVGENLQAILLMYRCVSTASYDMNMLLLDKGRFYMNMLLLLSSSDLEAHSIFSETCNLLKRKENRLIEDISGMITEAKVKAFSNADHSWDIEIVQGRGEVHPSVRLLTDCIVWMRKEQALSHGSAQGHNTEKLCDLIDDTMGYLKNMIQEKSELCLVPSLRYMFLLNNSYFVAQLSESSISLDLEVFSVDNHGFELTPECEKHMDSYLEVSWGHVLSCISTSKKLGSLRIRHNTSSLAKFHSAFHKTYQAQKFWKVPDPDLRSLLRETITQRLISAYRDYLHENPLLEKLIREGSISPDGLEEMVGELFEG